MKAFWSFGDANSEEQMKKLREVKDKHCFIKHGVSFPSELKQNQSRGRSKSQDKARPGSKSQPIAAVTSTKAALAKKTKKENKADGDATAAVSKGSKPHDYLMSQLQEQQQSARKIITMKDEVISELKKKLSERDIKTSQLTKAEVKKLIRQ